MALPVSLATIHVPRAFWALLCATYLGIRVWHVRKLKLLAPWLSFTLIKFNVVQVYDTVLVCS